ncbi:HelD family protein [Saccharopolyspora griseoalba]|uniref:HelD family protein n=1 Tax=Saccharopolyspora griseoalba TaxID=1431848 RepID=A0ABW2LFW8_9PSEU
MTSGELEFEQEYVASLYAYVDQLRARAAARVAAGGDPDVLSVWRCELARLGSVEEGLCFGRLDMDDGRRIYIGRIGLFREADDAELLVDWRAPVARAFYTATTADPQGVRRRRRISTRGRSVIALDDELLDSDGAEEHLVGEAALLAAVTANRTGRMHEIVTTLQAEQDAIIRSDERGALVVQGGPGTGKTAVALHRVAYLLYTHEHLRNRGVLVIGPSDIFLDYIGQVLPGLGENRVVSATVPELHPNAPITRIDPPEVAERKGSAEMAAILAAAVRDRVRIPEEPVGVPFEGQVLVLDPADWEQAVGKARAAGVPHNQARLVFQHEVVGALTDRLAERMEAVAYDESGNALDGGSADGSLGAADLRALESAGIVVDPEAGEGARELLDEDDKSALRSALLADAGVRDELDLWWPELTAEEVVGELVDCDPGDWSAADVALLDEAAALLGSGEQVTYGHVVVDEAQELSEMAWRMLMRRCPSRSMTIVGDLAQTGNPAGARSWDRVLGAHLADRWRLAELTVNYRTPSEVMAATTDLLAAAGPGWRPPESVRSTGNQPWRRTVDERSLGEAVQRAVGERGEGKAAVIAPADRSAELARLLGVSARPELTADVVVLTARQAKGLEFDEVVIADPGAIMGSGAFGANDLYVAMTRATQRLGLVCVQEVPAELARVRELRAQS